MDGAHLDGTYKAALPNGKSVTAEFKSGVVTAVTDDGLKSGTYEISGRRVVVTAGDKTVILMMEGGHLHGQDGDVQFDFVKTK